MTNPFKEKMSLQTAIGHLKQGKRVRRISDTCGYVKVTKEAAGYKEEVYASYRLSDPKPNHERSLYFSLEDVLAEDWIVDE